jgi:CRISPR system Cascade subunit CasA
MMNLVTEKWIPVIGIDGKPDHASLMEVFTLGEKYADLSVRPHERVALMRLLICIAQAALAQKNRNRSTKSNRRA